MLHVFVCLRAGSATRPKMSLHRAWSIKHECCRMVSHSLRGSPILLSQGLPAVSLQFGPWGGAGMATGDARLARQLAASGAPPLPPIAGLTALAAAMTAVQGGLPIDQVPVGPLSLSFSLGTGCDCERNRMGSYLGCCPGQPAHRSSAPVHTRNWHIWLAIRGTDGGLESGRGSLMSDQRGKQQQVFCPCFASVLPLECYMIDMKLVH